MSCLFDSLSYFIDENSYDIRQKICDYMQDNKPIIEGLDTNIVLSFENQDHITYIENMRKTLTLGGAIEIQVACNIWNLKINVKNGRDIGDKDIDFLPIDKSYERVIDICWTGNHYDPIK